MDIRVPHGSALPGGVQHTTPPASPDIRPANPHEAPPLQPRRTRQNAATEHLPAASAGQPKIDRSSAPIDLRAGQVRLERLRAFEALVSEREGQTPATPPVPLRTRPLPAATSTSRCQTTGASSSRPGTDIPDALPIVPARLREKFEAIDLKKLRKLDKDLYQYAKHVIEQASTGSQPNESTVDMDKQHLPLLAAMENHRHPGLNLNVFSTPEKCHQAIRDKQGEVERDRLAADMRIVFPPYLKLPDHHVALDVRFRPGKPPSIIIYESAMQENAHLQIKAVTGAIRPAPQVSLVFNIIQYWPRDSVMFAFNAALKSFKTHEVYAAGIHDGQGQRNHVPPEFKKHMYSKSAAEKEKDANAIITKDKTGDSTETLLQRVEAYSADRAIENKSIAYSTSIEGFRLQEIRRAGEYLAEKKSPKRSWLSL
ncbi:MAG: hypothetical protein JF606_14780 [Burkholderiales bacterium]|jgi:hypothetical protein|nr:hypothetical protein [Burkholderiales bacterium]